MTDELPEPLETQLRKASEARQRESCSERRPARASRRFVEAPWPDYEQAQQVFPTSADGGAYWKRPPTR